MVPFDFSEISKKALDYTVSFIGLDRDIRILLAHITNGKGTPIDDGQFEDVKESLAPSFRGTLEWVAKKGTLTESIIDIQKTEAIDLVIMGTSGIGDKTDEAVTNTAKLVVEADNCPVLVIPRDTEEFKIDKIALVLGKEKIEDRSVLETLLRIARRFNAKVVVLTIQNEEGVYGYSENDESNENLLEYYLEGFYSHHAFIENQDIIKGIADYTEKNTVDMVVILPRNHSPGSEPSEGRLTKELTMHSRVPILAID